MNREQLFKLAKTAMADYDAIGLHAALAIHMAKAVAALEAVGFSRDEAIRIATSERN